MKKSPFPTLLAIPLAIACIGGCATINDAIRSTRGQIEGLSRPEPVPETTFAAVDFSCEGSGYHSEQKARDRLKKEHSDIPRREIQTIIMNECAVAYVEKK